MNDALAGRTALITGAARGIGRGIALEIARAGGRVVIADLDGEAAIATAAEFVDEGHEAVGLALDVTDGASADDAVAATIARFGSLDILVNNAGIHRESLDRLSTIDDFETVFDVNLYEIWRMSQAVAPHLRARGGGKIVNVASINGRRPWAETPAYSASKAAAINLTQSLALTLGPDGINVNAVCPGSTFTPMADQFAFEQEAFQEKALGKRAVKRVLTPADLGHAVVFLASPQADLITGQSLNVDGGVELN